MMSFSPSLFRFFKTLLLPLVFSFAACRGNGQSSHPHPSSSMSNTTATLYLAGGCFWGTEHYLKQIRGVINTQTGYANGNIDHPTYEQVCTRQTGFAEAVRVDYDPEQLPLTLLVQLYFRSIDPTALNRQGNDIGTQYRTGIYYTDPAIRPILQAELAKLEAQIGKKVVVELLPLKNFFDAETYHQDYLDKNPTGYCHIPRSLFEFAKTANAAPPSKTFERPSDADLKTRLSDLQYAVTQQAATERPYTNEYAAEFREGIYVDITTGQPLFLSTDKFESGCGWPAFSKPIDPHLLAEHHDSSHGMERTEVRSARGNAHLGHVFNDGPKASGGLRYCINSASLRFVPKADMAREGYAAWLPLLETPTTGH